MNEEPGALKALIVTTVAFSVCFACWVINAVLVTYVVNNGLFDFTGTQIGWLLSLPILTGALSRVPLGIMTDLYGGRTIFFVLMLVTAVPLFLVSQATTYSDFLFASLGFGLAGGSFAVGVGYVAVWFRSEKQGTALGVFGVGNAGAAITTLLAPTALIWLTGDGGDMENWRQLPKIYAGILVVTAIGYFLLTSHRLSETDNAQSIMERLSPLRDLRVWRFGFYYALVFGGFVAITQWIVPYSINVYQISIVQAGLIATIFSLPSGAIRAVGGWMSDRIGARTVMYWVFSACAISTLMMAVPRMDIDTPGDGRIANAPGQVTSVSNKSVTIAGKKYALIPPLSVRASKSDDGSDFLPRINRWHEPMVKIGDHVIKGQLLARGVTNIYYPANIWLFILLVLVFGVAAGIGKAGVYKFIPDYFPNNIGAVGGMVGLLGALGGFVFPPVFGYLLSLTGIWASSWFLIGLVSIACLWWMHHVVRKIMHAEAPDLDNLLEFRPRTAIPIETEDLGDTTVEARLRQVPMFEQLTDEELTSLATIGAYQTMRSGEVLFHEGEPGDIMYVVLEGSIRVYRTDEGEDGEEITIELATLTKGDVLGELALIDGEPRSASAQLANHSSFLSIGRDDFVKLLSSSPRILGDTLVGLSHKIRQSNSKHYDAIIDRYRLQSEGEIERHRVIAEMVTGVAHEVNTPIGIANHAASIISEMLAADKVGALAKDESAENIISDVADASKLIQDNIARANVLIQTFKNLSARQISEEMETVDIKDITQGAIDLFQLKAAERRIEVEIIDNLKDDKHMWQGFPGQYGQIILNLLTNVERYAYDDEGGKVDITLERSEPRKGAPRFIVSVRDYGRGISDEVLEKIWDPFFTTGRAKGGTGLGLSIVRNLVSANLHGRAEVESTLGEGTRIKLKFPCAMPPLRNGDTAETENTVLGE